MTFKFVSYTTAELVFGCFVVVAVFFALFLVSRLFFLQASHPSDHHNIISMLVTPVLRLPLPPSCFLFVCRVSKTLFRQNNFPFTLTTLKLKIYKPR